MNHSNNTTTPLATARRFSLAPMMDWSDKHCRYFWRLLTKHSLLYTEMVTTGALTHGDREKFLDYNTEEHPIAIQLGGNSPQDLAECAKMAEQWGYDEVNLNCGCPSDRVQSGKIGAILMTEPELVAECVDSMRNACGIPITVKHRIGVDDMDDYEGMHNFVTKVAESGCDTFIVHARKAWLKGLSPKENREIPPLKYDYVVKLKKSLPHLNISINGGIKTIEHAETLLTEVDGVMVGREAYQNPFFLRDIDQRIFHDQTAQPISRIEIAEAYAEYCEREVQNGVRLHHLTRHMLGLFQGQPRGRLFRKYLSDHATQKTADVEVLREALKIPLARLAL